MKVVFYSLLKTEGDILFEMSEYDLAIRCYKTLKDYCRSWGSMEYLKMKTYEQIATVYATAKLHQVQKTYLKKAL